MSTRQGNNKIRKILDQQIDQVPHVQRLCPCRSSHVFDSNFAQCHSLIPSLFPLFPVHSSAVLFENKGTKTKKSALTPVESLQKINWMIKNMKTECRLITTVECFSLFSLFLCPPGFLLFKDFCMNEIDEAVPQLKFYEEVSLKCPMCARD